MTNKFSNRAVEQSELPSAELFAENQIELYFAHLQTMPGFIPVYVKTVRPAVALGRGVTMRGRIKLSSGKT